MSHLVGASPSTVVVTDASVLVNFLRIDRMDLIAGHSHAFIVTDHVADEVSDRYPDQQRRFAAAVKGGALSEESVANRAEIALFGTLSASGRLGSGECSAIAVAVHRRHMLAIDDRRATIQARGADRTLRILRVHQHGAAMPNHGASWLGRLRDAVHREQIREIVDTRLEQYRGPAHRDEALPDREPESLHVRSRKQGRWQVLRFAASVGYGDWRPCRLWLCPPRLPYPPVRAGRRRVRSPMKQRHEGTLSGQGASETTREDLVSGRVKGAL